MKKLLISCSLCCLLFTIVSLAGAQTAGPLPSWNDSPTKQAILDFVRRVTTESDPHYVVPAERIATFDNDGTLWAEQPLYFQLFFAIDRIHSLASMHPEWRTQEPFAALLRGDIDSALAGGDEAILEVITASHAGMTTDEFAAIVKEWLATARHPETRKPYAMMIYQPMVELLEYLRQHGFKTYIVSGGGIGFMRPWVEYAYGIPPEQVIGSSVKTTFEMRGSEPVIVRLPELAFLNDKAGKPIAINSHIGRRPIFAFGNSDGDLQMLQWAAAGSGLKFMGLVHHTDGQREWSYDRKSHIGRLDTALDEAIRRGWTVVDMKRDWNRVFPFETKP